jgi:hypothetical protein
MTRGNGALPAQLSSKDEGRTSFFMFTDVVGCSLLDGSSERIHSRIRFLLSK